MRGRLLLDLIATLYGDIESEQDITSEKCHPYLLTP